MEPPAPERAAKLLAAIAFQQSELRRWDAAAAVHGLPATRMSLLEAAAAGKPVPSAPLLAAIAAGERLTNKLEWDVLFALRRLGHAGHSSRSG
jgi:hypothetical protein